MTEINEKKSNLGEAFWFAFSFGFLNPILREFLTPPFALFLASIITTCLCYYFFPKPNISFIRYFTYMQVITTLVISAIWLIPRFLQELIPKFWAFALPLFLLINAGYFIPTLDGSKRGFWWKWFVGSFVFAVLFGLLMLYLKS